MTDDPTLPAPDRNQPSGRPAPTTEKLLAALLATQAQLDQLQATVDADHRTARERRTRVAEQDEQTITVIIRPSPRRRTFGT